MNTVQRADVLLNEKFGVISTHLHGQFAEHLGELVYPGIWVGEDSPIPNVGGLRKDVIDALKPLHLPVVRWPGGCFAEGYHWRNGISTRDQRPMRINYYWGMVPEPNMFGTHEFMAFCRVIGSEPYFTGNMGSGTAQEIGDWVEYCNFVGDSSLSSERRDNGSDQPFGVKFWAVGNENWGCGGRMDPETYAAVFARMRTFMFDYPGSPLHAIACGASGNDWDWTRRVLLVQEDRCVTTPTYLVYDLYQQHKNGTAVRLVSQAETVSDDGAAADNCRAQYPDKRAFALQAIQGSASVRGDTLCVTVCNTHPEQPVELELALDGGHLDEAEVVRLGADDIHAHNTFENPNAVHLTKPDNIAAKGKTLRIPLPPASVTRVMGKLH